MSHSARGTRRRHGYRAQSSPDPSLRTEVVREFGDTWSRQAWHARVWSYLLTEIPTQLYEHDRQARSKLANRVKYLRQFFPDSEECARLEQRLSCRQGPSARIAANGLLASIYRQVGEWPNEHETRVDFALNGGGELAIRCTGAPQDGPRMPAVLLGPHADRNAQEEAARLVRAAIRIVADPLDGVLD